MEDTQTHVDKAYNSYSTTKTTPLIDQVHKHVHTQSGFVGGIKLSLFGHKTRRKLFTEKAPSSGSTL